MKLLIHSKLQRCSRWSWEWISNFISHFTGYLITYPYVNEKGLLVTGNKILWNSSWHWGRSHGPGPCYAFPFHTGIRNGCVEIIIQTLHFRNMILNAIIWTTRNNRTVFTNTDEYSMRYGCDESHTHYHWPCLSSYNSHGRQKQGSRMHPYAPVQSMSFNSSHNNSSEILFSFLTQNW